MADLLQEARDAYDEAVAADLENMEAALTDFRFAAGDQWPAEVLSARGGRDARPTLTIDRSGQFIRQVTGELRQSPPAIRVRPMDNTSDPQMAEVFTGLIRNIEAQSGGPSRCYIPAAEHSVTGGIGHFRVLTQYASDDSWDQDVFIRPVPSAFSVIWDSGSRSIVRDDAMFCFVTDRITQKEFERRYPKAVPSDWPAWRKNYATWTEGDLITIAEWWRKVPVKRTLLLLEGGHVIEDTEKNADLVEQARAVGAIKSERRADGFKITSCIMSGDQMLEEPSDWAGRYIPVIPVIGEELNVGDKIMRRGMVRLLRDSQRLYNYQRSAFAEAVALAPKAKWKATADHIAGYEDLWRNANTTPSAVLVYTPDAKAPGGPERVAPDMPAASILSDMQVSASDMEAVTGLYRASLGQQQGQQSGRAKLMDRKEGDTGTFVYRDHLEQAVAHCGRILIDLIPKIYDTPRIVRTLGEDGTEDFVAINQPGGINDLTVGKYDVTATSGPGWSTRREEARESMVATLQGVPVIGTIAPDLIVKAQDWPDADKIAARLRKTLPPGIAEPEEGDPPPAPPQPSPEMVLAQAEVMKAQAAQARAEIERDKAQAEVQLKVLELQQDGIKIDGDLRIKEQAQKLDAIKFGATFTQKAMTPPKPPGKPGQGVPDAG